MHNSVNSIANWTHACSTLANTSISLGNATRRTSPAFPVIAPSLGGVESLLTVPARTSHVGMSPDDRASAGITDTLIRMSVGIEATEDVIEDLDQALS